MTYLAYNVVLAVVAAIGLPYYVIRARLRGQPWSSLPQRFGLLPRSFHQTGSQSIWLHAVSVGEVLSCEHLVRVLKQRFPSAPLFVSTGTVTGQQLAREKLSEVVDGIFYAPLDLPFAVRRVVARLTPRVAIIAETEIWPNLFRQVKRSGAGLMMVNARISDRSFPSYRRFRFLFSRVLRNVDGILAQSEVDAQRLTAIGAPRDRVKIGGNLKYDFDPTAIHLPGELRGFLERTRPHPIIVAGSTREDEEQPLIAAFQTLTSRRDRALLVLAPRHPRRFGEVADLLGRLGVKYQRRSELRAGATALSKGPAVLLLDTLGELSSLYPLADLVFVGGSLNGWGGHNVLEPALSGRPVVVGPAMQNFRAITQELLAAGGLVQVDGPDQLTATFERLLDDPQWAAKIGARGLQVARTQRGATNRAVETADHLYGRAAPRDTPSVAARVALGLPAVVWETAARGRIALYQRGLLRKRRLRACTVCVGNLTVGGVGKTPMVAWLAERLHGQGYRVGILTRGYGRSSDRAVSVVAPGSKPPLSETGDEVQLLLRRLERLGIEAPIAIGADRYRAGTELEGRYAVEVLIMDDGFQHLQLSRDVNLLLVDVTRPFAGGYMMPLGRLREPVSAAARADVIVLTRTDAGRQYQAFEDDLGRLNPGAPVLHARHTVVTAVEAATGRAVPAAELANKRLLGVCGLGNPSSFQRSLRELGAASLSFLSFPDHHRYTLRDIARIAKAARQQQAEVLVTTEKDLMNFSEADVGIKGGGTSVDLPFFWLEIETEVADADELLRKIESKVAMRREEAAKEAPVDGELRLAG